jgi:LysM repeat protein
MRSSLRALTGSALTVGLLTFGASAAAADETYEVQAGDTLAQIARTQGVDSWRTIYEANSDKLADPNLIFPGQQLRLSGDATVTSSSGSTYTVQPGDTLASIGRDHGVDWQTLYDLNADRLSSPSLIFPGDSLRLSGDAPAPSSSTTSADSSASSTESSSTESSSTESSSTSSSSSSDIEPQGTVSMATWDRLAECESNGNWSINTGNGYYGGLQFALSSWEWVGGSGYPHEASKAEQIARAEILLERQGWEAWPACSRQLGLR